MGAGDREDSAGAGCGPKVCVSDIWGVFDTLDRDGY